MCAAWLPHLKAKKTAYLINISTGLAFVPLTRVPSYCATKVRVGTCFVSMSRVFRAYEQHGYGAAWDSVIGM